MIRLHAEVDEREAELAFGSCQRLANDHEQGVLAERAHTLLHAQRDVQRVMPRMRRSAQVRNGRIDVAELSRVCGVSRQIAHVWVKRYQVARHDLRAMQDRSRRPRTNR